MILNAQHLFCYKQFHPPPHPSCNLHTSPIVIPIVIPIVTSIVIPIITSIVIPIITRAVTA
jgi:hypothetical protein